MKFIKNNFKLIIVFILGLIFSGTVAYATGLFDSTDVNFDNTTAQLKKTDNSNVTNVQEAIEAINRKIPPTCASSPFKLGDYVDMTPASNSFTPDVDLTGCTEVGQSIIGNLNPSELSVWRVLRINGDCTVEVVSEYVSSVNVKFGGKTGYKNYIWYLNQIAKQYANITYTLNPSTAPDEAFRNVGYDPEQQTAQITDESYITDSTLGSASDKPGYGTKVFAESKGGGDTGFGTDMNLLNEANVNMRAYKANSTTFTSYWLASRRFYWYGTSVWYFDARYLHSYGHIYSSSLYYRNGSSFSTSRDSYAVRPIVTLDPTLFTVSGEGTSASHRILTAK